MSTADVPDFLTVTEAARVLRIGRTAAYQQANRWLHTGTQGLPVMSVGGSLRVPRAQFEAHFGIRITAIPPASPRGARKAPSAAPAQDIPRPGRSAGRRKSTDTTQDGLPFAG